MAERQPNCPATGRKVARRAKVAGIGRSQRCPDCGRVMHINYDGTISRHVANPRKGS